LVQLYGRQLNYNGRDALLCSIIDVTKRVRAEEERDRNRELLNHIVENVPVTIVVKDARNLQYVLINRAAEKLWGVSREELLGKSLHEVFGKEQADAIGKYDRQVVRARIYIRASTRLTRRATASVSSPQTASSSRTTTARYNICWASSRT